MTEAVNVAPASNKFAIGLTLKAGTGFEAEWITPKVYGQTAEEVSQNAVDLIKALADKGVVEMVSHAAVAVRSAHKGSGGGNATRGGAAAPKTFQGGRVVAKEESAGSPGDSCPHGRTIREGQGKAGPWAAMFCNAQSKAEQCDPLWRQKDGSFK